LFTLPKSSRFANLIVENVTPNRSLCIAGIPAARQVIPLTEAECVEIVRDCSSKREAIVPVGGATCLAQGNGISNPNWVDLLTAGQTGIEDYSPDDMVITVRAGTSLSEIQEELAKSNQFLPFDPDHLEIATIGGIVATNAHGLWRPAFGIPRDRLLGLRAVLADGSVVRAGGKVVKNVAGYDLCKLFAGSWGSLGVITEATFKSSPLPQGRKVMHFRGADASHLANAALQVHLARLQPIYLTVSVTKSAVLAVGLMGSNEQVAWQSERIAETLGQQGVKQAETGPSETEVRSLIYDTVSTISVRIALKPTDVPTLVDQLLRASRLGIASLTAHVPTGLVEAAIDVPRAIWEFPRAIRDLRALVPFPGQLVFTAMPEEFRDEIGDVWGHNRADFHIHQSIKRTLDPHSLFSPGRFIGRL
jgi:glycolate oxidase FAD binding subunit